MQRRVLALPEHRSAQAAIAGMFAHPAHSLHTGPHHGSRSYQTLLLHGPTGVGKSYLLHHHGRSALTVQAGDWPSSAPDEKDPFIDEATQAELLVVEDLQRLPQRADAVLSQILDRRARKQMPTILTATGGPRLLHSQHELSARLCSRLAGGLVVAIESWSAPTRLRFLETLAQHKQLALAPEILVWLAETFPGGGRQLEGAMNQVQALASLSRTGLTLAEVREHFRDDADANRPTLERIVQRVGSYFQVKAELLRSALRTRPVMLPRQVSMYLARRLTGLSLDQIGAYFGGRDHTTVLHACRKVEAALARDAVLSGAVQQLHAEFA